MSSARPLQIAVLVSGQGRGTNLQALIDAGANGSLPARVAVLIATRSDSPAVERAQMAGIAALTISPKRFGDLQAYGDALIAALRGHEAGLVCLAGYMLRLPGAVIDEFPVMNVHAALLPLFGGQGMYGERVHEAVLQSGMKISGCTVHFADNEYDTGPIIVQRTVPVLEEDTPQSLAARVLPEEHRALVEAVRLFALGRLRIEGRRVHVLDEG